MKYEDKTMEQLIDELEILRKKVAELEVLEAEHKRLGEVLRKKEEEGRQLARENEIVAAMGRIISSTLNIEEVYKLFSERVRELIPFNRIVISLIDFEKNVYTVPYIEGISVSERKPGDVVPLSGTATEMILQTRKGFIIQLEDENEIAAKTPGLLPLFRHGIRSALTVPLISRDRVIGGFGLRSTNPGAYSDRHLKLAENIANQIAGAIANAQFFVERERLIYELQEALSKVKMLSGLLPICASCKKVRDDKGYWTQIETYHPGSF